MRSVSATPFHPIRPLIDSGFRNSVVRAHWDRNHFGQVKQAYKAKYSKDLSMAVMSETSGDFREGLMTMINQV